MSAKAGWQAIVQIGGTLVTMTGIKTADLSISGDIYDITDLNNNQWKKKLFGLADYTLKLAGNYDLSDAQQASIQAAIITSPGTAVAWAVFPAGVGGPKYSGTSLVKTEGVKFAVNAEETVSWDLEGNGAIAYA